ncbi:MAG: hypothetical protein AAGK97_08625 [Bacteroidota bacterium]
MSEAKESKAKYWMITAISFAAIVILLVVKPEFFWVALPFFFTYLTKAFDVI